VRKPDRHRSSHWVVEQLPEVIDTDALLLMLKRRVQRHVVLGERGRAWYEVLS